ncbi:Putative phage abortive infection protein [Chryseobacterium oleae]|uniref:Putative phage abortive infection protein n=1 Tax=Chryseobacterium oleae TaxID=491207 RepID=A0A1I4VPQ1_CHROL|nr:putative phage abortive infection protein [Chryseobacterium oleae]SFN03113.1 Putative phage abortive infection protein [Chryseobacterium oleae]
MKTKTIIIFFVAPVVGVLGALFLYYEGPEFVQSRYFYDTDRGNRGAIGDAFGGTAGPVIAWFASILTFLAFYIQYEANKDQRDQFAKQADDIVIERFENRFFELIRLHRENVDEQNIQNKILGRKAFTTYYFELRYIYFVLESKHDEFPTDKRLDKEQLTNLAYLIFFYGIGHVSDSVFSHILPQINSLQFFKVTIEKLEKEKKMYSDFARDKARYESEKKVKNTRLKDLEVEHKGKKAIFILHYEPFTGHGTKIGHYYRHLFQTVKYVDSQEHKVFKDKDNKIKYEYVKILRAQLSNFEQVILYYNSICILGNTWISNGYIKNYHLLTNLPLSFADFGIQPDKKFKAEMVADPNFFDWEMLKDSFH